MAKNASVKTATFAIRGINEALFFVSVSTFVIFSSTTGTFVRFEGKCTRGQAFLLGVPLAKKLKMLKLHNLIKSSHIPVYLLSVIMLLNIITMVLLFYAVQDYLAAISFKLDILNNTRYEPEALENAKTVSELLPKMEKHTNGMAVVVLVSIGVGAVCVFGVAIAVFFDRFGR